MGHAKLSPKFKGLSLAAASLLLVVGFQNCTKQKSVDQNGTSVASNSPQNGKSPLTAGNEGGDGYDGKLYVNRLLNSLCPDGTDVRSRIYVKGEQAQLVRDNCQPVTPQTLQASDLDLYNYNLNNLVYTDHVFDLYVTPVKPTSFLCRSMKQVTQSNEITTQASDVVIKPQGDGTFTGNVILAVYAALNQNPNVFSTGELPYTQQFLNGGGPDTATHVFAQTYTGQWSNNGTFQLSIDDYQFLPNPEPGEGTPHMRGTLVYTANGLTFGIGDLINAFSLTFDLLNGTVKDPRTIPSFSLDMDCYRQ